MSAETISLYFTLKAGEKADLEVVAKAALEWLDAVRAAARELEPGAQIKVEIVDADYASLSLNTVFEWVESQLERIDRGSGRYPRLRKLAVALALFVPTTGVQTYSYYFGPQPIAVLSEEDRKLLEEDHKLLRELLERTTKNPEVDSKREKFFRTLERDPSITGAGLLEEPKAAAPLVLVPSGQFAERSGLWALQTVEEAPTERTIYPVIDVTLVSPVLVPKPRSWLFQPDDGLPEFRATMKDMAFLAALDSDHVKESLRTGIRMTLRMMVKEQRFGDVWLVKRKGRSIVEVISPKVV